MSQDKPGTEIDPETMAPRVPADDGLVRKEIYPCPCGQSPVALMCEVDNTRKRGNVFGDCCGEWQVEFNNNYTQDKEKMAERARKAWNAAPRPD